MPESRENAELAAKGIHPRSSSPRLLDWLGSGPVRSSGTGCIGMCVLLLCLLLCIGIETLSFFFSYGTPQQTSKQEEYKHGVGGCLILLQLQLHYYAPPFQRGFNRPPSSWDRLHSVFQFPRVLPRTLIGNDARTCVRVRAVHSPGQNKQNSLSLIREIAHNPRTLSGTSQRETYTILLLWVNTCRCD